MRITTNVTIVEVKYLNIVSNFVLLNVRWVVVGR